ncbi:MAG TPA: sigma 54-interacting transcriptional regulator [Polyangiaceae bacterium]|jgi:Nif-specific regulatory protein|nr:sigma 54-interacting transcriptional regulator [Polyangiaceae bacterium]
MLRLAIRSGTSKGRSFDAAGEVVRIGRAPTNDLVLEDVQVSAEHARIVLGPASPVLEDLRSTNGTALLRGAARTVLGEGAGYRAALESGDVIELGSGEAITTIAVSVDDDSEEARVVAVRKIEDLGRITAGIEQNPRSLSALYRAQKHIGASTSLEETLVAVADAVLSLVPNATHVTIVLRDVDEADGAYVPMLTRIRAASGEGTSPAGSVPITRSVFRKVVGERAAVLAADAPRDVGQSESLMGASIRSTIGVPLWKGDDILGVLQVDNRHAPAMLSQDDVEVLTVLAANASLAIESSRLIKRLVAAEERLNKENAFLKSREEKRQNGEKPILGKSQAMQAVLGQLEKVVDTRVTVLIEGETGTGKELVASALHYRSRRRDKLFVTQNCAAVPENLLESELFGHRRGAFTGATEDKKGLFEIADGGTLFLDEVTEMPLSLQAKLLRVLQEGEVRPLGATQPKHVSVRIVAASNRNLEKEVAAGRFREDLYYRLKVFPLRVPPLRERRDDIALLAAAFLNQYATEFQKPVGGLTQQATELLVAYDWPGNVRELQNEMQRVVIELDENGFVTKEHLSPRIRHVEGVLARALTAKGTLREMMDAVEKYVLLEALRDHNNNKTSTAKTLGITREGLHKKLRQFGIG